MLLVADTHVHLYPCYRLDSAVAAATGNLNRWLTLNPLRQLSQQVKLVCLTERHDCHFFYDLHGRCGDNVGAYSIRSTEEDDSLQLVAGSGESLFLLAGRQIISAERLEVLALTRDLELEDGMPAGELINTILDSDAIPVLPWSPGKWLGKRGRLVSRLLREYATGVVLVGDIPIRPWWWLTPPQIRFAQKLAIPVLGGSDPLPFATEERMIGSYGVVTEAIFDQHRPGDSFRQAVRGMGSRYELCGTRGSTYQLFRRLIKNRLAKR